MKVLFLLISLIGLSNSALANLNGKLNCVVKSVPGETWYELAGLITVENTSSGYALRLKSESDVLEFNTVSLEVELFEDMFGEDAPVYLIEAEVSQFDENLDLNISMKMNLVVLEGIKDSGVFAGQLKLKISAVNAHGDTNSEDVEAEAICALK